MNLASTSNRWLNRLYKTVAIILVLLAVLISAFRLFLPYVENYRVDFQDYLNEINQTNIIIGSLNVAWQGAGPSIVMNNVSLLNSEQASVFINNVTLQVDFWQTISQQHLVSSNVVLTGAKVNISQELWERKGSTATPSTKLTDDLDNNKNDANDFEVVADIFLNRLNQFTIRNSDIIVKSETLARGFHINKLTWLNDGDLHQGQGSVVLNSLSFNNLALRVRLTGDDISELNGQVYLEGNHLDITPWLDNILAIDNDKTRTDISFSTWLNVDNSAVDRLQVELAENKISWLFKDEQQQLTLGHGQLLLVKGKQKQAFKLFSTPLSLQFNQQLPQNLTFMLNKKSSDYSAHISTIDLSLASQLAPLFTTQKASRDLLAKLSLTGQMNDLYIRNRPQENPLDNDNNMSNQIQAVANFSNVSNRYSYGIPGITNLSGHVSFDNDYLTLKLLAQEGMLDFDKHFVAPFNYQSLSAQASMDFNELGWSLAVNELDFTSDHINLSGQVQLEAPVSEPLTMALLVNVNKGNAGNVGHYLPLSIMSENLVNYLNRSFVSGTIEEAQVLLNGPLANFPFTDNSGIFVVDAELTDSTFKFADNWPAINDFSANLNFTNNSMLITGREGDLTGLDVTGVKAAIDDLAHQQILSVDVALKPTQAKSIAKLMDNSPLKNTVGSVLGQLNVGGEITGSFGLHLPLNDLASTVASGKINFKDNQLALQTPRMDFTQVQGQLDFVNGEINTESLSLLWQGLPLALQVTGIDKAEYYNTDIQLTANWPENTWQQHVPLLLQKYLKDEVNWQGNLSLHQHHQGGFSYDFKLQSDLLATTLNLPAPYGKNAQQKNNLVVKVNGQLQQSKITAQLDNNLRFYGELNHQNTHFSRAHLVLGDEQMLLPMDGFHITTKLKQADFSLWQPLLSDVIASIETTSSQDEFSSQQVVNNKQSSPLFAKPERIRGTIGKLAILGQELNNVSFNLLDKQDWWLLQLNAKETRSQLKFYPNWLEQGVDINAEFIHLNQNEKKHDLKEDSPLMVSKSIQVEQSKLPPDNKVQERSIDTVVKDSQTKADLEKNVQEYTYQEYINQEQTIKEVINSSDSIFASIPPLKLHCDRCEVASLNLGKVDFTVARTADDTIEIKHFSAEREQAKLSFAATWVKNEAMSQTSLSGDMSLNSIEYELKQLGLDSIIRDSGGKGTFDLNWQGGPHDFALAKLNGNYQAKLDDGYLAEVSDKARIFSVLSLESLVRKLTLDFRDIFSDGMFYSDIEGDYKIEQGILTTANTKMNGTAGNLLVTGQTNLSSGELDYNMSYKPNLSSSLPALAWIATLDPVTFLAGIAIDQVIKSQVVSEFNFTLTGTVNEPNFQQVGQEQKNIRVSGSSAPEIVESENEVKKLNSNENLPTKHLEQYKQKKETES